MVNNLGLPDTILADVVSTIKAHPLIQKAAIFGSCAKGTYKKYSDIDIAIWGEFDRNEPQRVFMDLDDLPTVYKFDVVAYDFTKNEALKKHIDRVGVVIYTA